MGLGYDKEIRMLSPQILNCRSEPIASVEDLEPIQVWGEKGFPVQPAARTH